MRILQKKRKSNTNLKNMTGRIITNIVIVISILFLPWWATVLLVCAGILLFPHFYEAIIAGVLMDVLYGVSMVSFSGFVAVFTVIFSLGYLLGERFKKNVRLYVS